MKRKRMLILALGCLIGVTLSTGCMNINNSQGKEKGKKNPSDNSTVQSTQPDSDTDEQNKDSKNKKMQDTKPDEKTRPESSTKDSDEGEVETKVDAEGNIIFVYPQEKQESTTKNGSEKNSGQQSDTGISDAKDSPGNSSESGNKTGSGTGAASDHNINENAGNKTDNKSENKTDNNIEDESDNKPDNKPDNKTDETSKDEGIELPFIPEES